MKKTVFGALLLAVIAIFVGCKKQPLETPQATICMKRELTQCSDPWGIYNLSMGSAEVFFNTYFTNNNLQATFSSITLPDSTFVAYTACQFSSGYILYVQAASQSVQTLTGLGFVPCQAEATVCMKKALTKCAEPWGSHHGEVATPSVFFTNYFLTNNINATFTNITTDSTLTEDCEACSCLSGEILEIEASPEAVEQLRNLGFASCIWWGCG